MRSFSAAAMVVAALAVSACGGPQPRVYRVALDRTNEKQIGTASCFLSNNPPAFRPLTTQNLVDDVQWVVWDGEQTTQYLDVGTMRVTLADAAAFTVSELIRSDANAPAAPTVKAFTAVKTATCAGIFAGTGACANTPNATSQINWTASFNFEQLGALAVGNLTVNSGYVCQGGTCPSGNAVPFTSCTTSLSFVGRRIEGSNLFGYTPQGTTP